MEARVGADRSSECGSCKCRHTEPGVPGETRGRPGGGAGWAPRLQGEWFASTGGRGEERLRTPLPDSSAPRAGPTSPHAQLPGRGGAVGLLCVDGVPRGPGLRPFYQAGQVPVRAWASGLVQVSEPSWGTEGPRRNRPEGPEEQSLCGACPAVCRWAWPGGSDLGLAACLGPACASSRGPVTTSVPQGGSRWAVSQGAGPWL